MGVQLRLDLPRMGREHQDAVADDDRFLDGVGDEQHGEAHVVPKLKQLLLHPPPGQGVECGERLVHQQDFRLGRHGAGDGDALLHAARQGVRIAVAEAVQPDLGDVVPGALLGFPLRHASRAQREQDVLEHGLPGQKLVEFLEHDHAVRPRTNDRRAVQPDRPFDRLDEAGHGLQQAGLAAARRPQKHETVAPVDLEIDLVCGGDQTGFRLVLQASRYRRRAGRRDRLPVR